MGKNIQELIRLIPKSQNVDSSCHTKLMQQSWYSLYLGFN